jgi:inner membrane protease ATP23
MYDNVRSKDYDSRNCHHLACSEIRAANLSGYCSNDFSYLNAYTSMKRNKIRNFDCVKSKAVEHINMYYSHCTKHSMEYVNDVWDKCYLDNSPIKDFMNTKSFI